MRAPRTPEEFIRLLEKSQLLKRSLFEKIKPQLQQFGAEGDTPERLAKSLVKNRILTPYQSAQLLKGRWNGFYIGKYRLLDLLGRGGMGKVYLAEQITMQRVVAVKVVRPRAASDRVNLARFVREARAVAQLRHPNVVQAYDFDAYGGVPYIVMEYIEGLNCDEILLHFGPVPYPQACDFIMQAAEGLQHAHELGLVHRDIKPGNLIVESTGTLKILDLGLVTCLGPEDGQLTKRDEHVGTADYLAPEQGLDSRDVDIRADIYSLGCTMYHLLAGHPVFPDRSTTQKLLLHQTTMPTPIRNIVPDVPPEVDAILNKMLAKKREDRFQTPAELAEALAPFAQRRVPPFDLSAIRFKLKDLEPFLKRGPSPSSIIGRNSLDSQIVKRTAQATDDDSVVTEGVVDPELRAILAGVEDTASETQRFLEGEKNEAEAQVISAAGNEGAAVGVAVVSKTAVGAASGVSGGSAVAVAAADAARRDACRQ
ncbi:MAG: serine/threonine protein kinase, partial [Planctomycetota bacterium]